MSPLQAVSSQAPVVGSEMPVVLPHPQRAGDTGQWKLLALCLIAANCLLPAAPFLFALRGRYEVTEVRPHIFIWVPEDIVDQEGDSEFSRAGTAGFIITGEGVVVVNTTNSPFHARELLFEIRARTDQPVKYVINTDSRADHMLGNEVFADLQATILSTSAAQAGMRRYQQELARRLEDDFRLQARMRGIHPTPSNQTFDGDTTLRVGGEEIKLLSVRAGPSAGDAVVYVPEAKVLLLGELFENGYIPQTSAIDFGAWIETLRTMENWDVEFYVPGHGPPAEKQELREFRRFLEWLRSQPAIRIPQGKPPRAVQAN